MSDEWLAEFSFSDRPQPPVTATFRQWEFRCSSCGRRFEEADRHGLPDGAPGYALVCRCGSVLSTVYEPAANRRD